MSQNQGLGFVGLASGLMIAGQAIGNAVSSIFVSRSQVKIAKEQRKQAVRVAKIRGQTAVTLGVTKQETVTAVVPLVIGIGALALVTSVLRKA